MIIAVLENGGLTMANEVRLINYDAAIDRYYAEYERQDICDGAQDRDWLKKCFDEAPTSDPESLRPKGRWVYDEGNMEMACSECLCAAHVRCGDKYDYILSDYCPNCGAKMMEG